MNAPDEAPDTSETRDESHGRRMARHRESRGFTQRDLARVMRLRGHRWTQQTVAAIETGERQLKLAEAVDVMSALGGAVEDLTDEPRQLEARTALAEYRDALSHQVIAEEGSVERTMTLARTLNKLAEEGIHLLPDELPGMNPVRAAGDHVIQILDVAVPMALRSTKQAPTARHLAEEIVTSAKALRSALDQRLGADG